MKKAIAVMLSILCILSCFTCAVCALEDPGLIGMLEPEEPLLYVLTYQNQTFSDVSMMYQPNPSLSLEDPAMSPLQRISPLPLTMTLSAGRTKTANITMPAISTMLTVSVRSMPFGRKRRIITSDPCAFSSAQCSP